MRRPYISTYFSPLRGAAQVVIGFIDRVDRSLDCAIYSLTHDSITDALIRAHKRGVKIRILMDKEQSGLASADDERLQAAGIAVRRDIRAGFMHAKYAVADHNVPRKWAVLEGSMNWTANGDARNIEHFQIVRLDRTVDEFAAHFKSIWDDNAPR